MSNQQFQSDLFQFLDDGTEFFPTPTFNDGLASNDVEYRFSDIYLGAHYRLKVGKFTITPGLSVHSYGNNHTQFGRDCNDNCFSIMPDF